MHSHLQNQRKERLAIHGCYSFFQKKALNQTPLGSHFSARKMDQTLFQNIIKKHTMAELPPARLSKAVMSFEKLASVESGPPVARRMTRIKAILSKHRGDDKQFQPNLGEIFLESKGLVDFSKYQSQTFWGKSTQDATELQTNPPKADPHLEPHLGLHRGLSERFKLASWDSHDRLLNIRSVVSPAASSSNFRPAHGKDWRKNYVILARRRQNGSSSSDPQLEVAGTCAPHAGV
jgi:hypothetical protein